VFSWGGTGGATLPWRRCRTTLSTFDPCSAADQWCPLTLTKTHEQRNRLSPQCEANMKSSAVTVTQHRFHRGCWGWVEALRGTPKGLNAVSCCLPAATCSLWWKKLELHEVFRRFTYLTAPLCHVVRPPMGLFFSCGACVPEHICPVSGHRSLLPSKSTYRFPFAVWPETGQGVSLLHGILGVIVLRRPCVWNLSSLMHRPALVNRLPKHDGQRMVL